MKFLRLLGAAYLLAAGTALAAEVEAKKDGVEIYADATNKSAVLGKMKSGEALKAGERKGMFWAVTAKDGKAGFVSILAVNHKADGNTDLANAVKSVVNEGRASDNSTESRARSAVMGVRGLAPDDNMANASNIRPNLRAVYKMEDSQVKEKRVKELGDDVFAEIAAKAGK
jgi:hypothetical protein